MKIHPRRLLTLRAYAIPLTLATAFYLPGIWFKQWLWDAGLYAAVSLRMARTGEWWTPMQANATYFNKPPLAFWVHALFVKVLGEADWVLRLPELLGALACVGLIVSIAGRLHGLRVGMMAGIALALSAEFIWRISRFRLDFMHTALMLAAVRTVLAGVLPRAAGTPARASSRPWWIVAAGIPVGMAMLVKPIFGLLALVLAGLWMLLAGARMRRSVRWLPAAAAVAVAVAAPWHLSMAHLHGPAFVERFFVHESLDRATGAEFRAEPWWWYLRYLIDSYDGNAPRGIVLGGGYYWPWVLCVLLAVAWWATGRRLTRRASTRGGLLAQVYTFGLLLALTLFGDKKSWYLIPVFPGMAWISAMWVTTVTPRRAWRWFERLIGPAALAALVLIITLDLRFERGKAQPADTRAIRDFIRANPPPAADYWNVSVWRYDSSPIYIRTGVWPKLIEDPNTGEQWEPPTGSYVIYDKQKRPTPAPADTVVVETQRFIMVRRGAGGPLPREEGQTRHRE